MKLDFDCVVERLPVKMLKLNKVDGELATEEYTPLNLRDEAYMNEGYTHKVTFTLPVEYWINLPEEFKGRLVDFLKGDVETEILTYIKDDDGVFDECDDNLDFNVDSPEITDDDVYDVLSDLEDELKDGLERELSDCTVEFMVEDKEDDTVFFAGVAHPFYSEEDNDYFMFYRNGNLQSYIPRNPFNPEEDWESWDKYEDIVEAFNDDDMVQQYIWDFSGKPCCIDRGGYLLKLE